MDVPSSTNDHSLPSVYTHDATINVQWRARSGIRMPGSAAAISCDSVTASHHISRAPFDAAPGVLKARREVGGACPTTRSAICSASPPSARATGRRSAAWSMAARPCIPLDGGRDPGRARPPPARPVALHHAAPGARRGQDPLRRVRGRAHRPAGHDRHADRAADRERRPALQGLFARSRTRTAPAMPTSPMT